MERPVSMEAAAPAGSPRIDARDPYPGLFELARTLDSGRVAQVRLRGIRGTRREGFAAALGALTGAAVVRGAASADAAGAADRAAAGAARIALPPAPAEESPTQRAARLFAWVEMVGAALPPAEHRAVRLSDALDAALRRPAVGVPVFLAITWLLLELATRLAAPAMAAGAWLVRGPIAAAVGWALDGLGAGDTWVASFVLDGVLLGVETVASFVPLIAIVFAGLGVLERSGYLARAAALTDSTLRRVGLDGHSTVPLILGYGCNVAAVTATRNIPSARHRIVTALLVPYTLCSARLVVQLFVATAIFPAYAGTAVFGMYVLSGAIVGAGALVLRPRRRPAQPAVPPILPPLHWPALGPVLRRVGDQVGSFVRQAGPLVIATIAAMWVALAVPAGAGTFAAVAPADSAFGAFAEAIAPGLDPMGAGDAQVAGALLTGVVAREAFVGGFVGWDGEAGPAHAAEDLQLALDASSGGHPVAAGVALLVFLLAYVPCVSTVAAQVRVLGWARAGAALGVQLAGAWLLACAVFQVGRLL